MKWSWELCEITLSRNAATAPRLSGTGRPALNETALNLENRQVSTNSIKKTVQNSRGQVSDIFGRQLNGHCLNSCKGPGNNSELEWWQVDGVLVIVQIWNIGGWDYYLQGMEGMTSKVADDVARHIKAARDQRSSAHGESTK